MSEIQNSIKKNIYNIKQDVLTYSSQDILGDEDVTVVAVSKYYPADYIRFANEVGQVDFGESRVQELLEKQDIIKSNLNWHFIGHLQSNKVKNMLNKISLLHSLDRIKLANEIERQCDKIDSKMDVLLQVNISKEDTKFGIYMHDVNDFVEKISKLKNVQVKGLMTMAPYTLDECVIGKTFGKLRKLFDGYKSQRLPENIEMRYISMGMSNDYIIALKEGSNMIRVGSSIFGEKM